MENRVDNPRGDLARSSVRWHEIAQSPEFVRLEALRRRITLSLLGGREEAALESFDEVRVRSATGLGAEGAQPRRTADEAEPRREPVAAG